MYGTPAGYREYHTARGRTVTGDDATIQARLLVASEWLDGAYRTQWPGSKTGQQAQLDDWPRTGVVDSDGYAVASDVVPTQIIHATYEVALRSDSLNKDFTPSKYQRVSISGAIDVTYRDQSAADIQAQFPVIGQILGSLLGLYSGTSGLSGKVVRA